MATRLVYIQDRAPFAPGTGYAAGDTEAWIPGVPASNWTDSDDSNATTLASTRLYRAFANSLSFNGSTKYVSVGLPSVLKLASISVALWVKVTTPATAQPLVTLAPIGQAAGSGVALRLASSKLTFDKGINGSLVTLAGLTNITSAWTLVGLSYDGVTMKVYVGGALDNSAADASAIYWTDLGGGHYPTPATLFLGAAKADAAGGGNTTPSGFYTGSLGELRVWNRALTAAEWLALNSDVVTRNGLLLEWLGSEGSGTTATDTASTNNGTLTAATYVADVHS